MIKKIFCILLVICTIFCMTACGKSNKNNEATLPTVVDLTQLVGPVGYYHEFQNQILNSDLEDDNYVISPLSFRSAMAPIAYGASGETQKQILTSMGFNTITEYETWVNNMSVFAAKYTFGEEAYNDGSYKELTLKDASDNNAFSIINSVWHNETYSSTFFKETYKQELKEKYNIDIHVSNANDFVGNVNDFVSHNTRRLIPELLSSDFDTTDVPAIFINTLYLKSMWKTPFVSLSSYSGKFTTSNGDIVQKDYMKNTGSFQYYKDADTELIVVPLQEGVNVAFVVGDCTNIYSDIANSVYQPVKFSVPKSSVSTSVNPDVFSKYLGKCGVTLAFGPDGDFSNMTDDKRFCADYTIQRATVDINENGIEASAATAVVGFGSTATQKYIDFNITGPYHFFIYTIDEHNTYNTLFFGNICK